MIQLSFDFRITCDLCGKRMNWKKNPTCGACTKAITRVYDPEKQRAAYRNYRAKHGKVKSV